MNKALNIDLNLIENMLYRSFEKAPFHNFYQRFNINPSTFEFGGTCSDKALSFLAQLKEKKVKARLYSSFIQGKETHRLVKISLDNKDYLADVGNGWPSIKLYPMFEEIEFSAFGMIFYNRLTKDKITVHHQNRGKDTVLFEAYFNCKSEEEIRSDVNSRFNSGIVYPFSGKIRFSQIVNGKFLFLKDDTLRIFGKSSFHEIPNIAKENIRQVIKEYFEFDVDKFENQLGIRIP